MISPKRKQLEVQPSCLILIVMLMSRGIAEAAGEKVAWTKLLKYKPT